MSRTRFDHVIFPGSVALAVGLLGFGSPRAAAAAPIVGFVESFTAQGDLGGFDGGAVRSNPGTGGVGGAGDGFLHVSTGGFASRLGTRNWSADFAGDWVAAGIRRVEFSLRDVDADQALEIHVAIGNANNFWQSTAGFDPPAGSWGSFAVDLSDSTNFTQIISFGGGGFASALRNADRILFRHDRAPFSQLPDAILGEFGLDEIRLLADLPIPAQAHTWGALKGLYR